MPACVPIAFIPKVFGQPGWQFATILGVIFVVDAGFEYYKWQEDKRNGLYQDQ